MSGRPGLTDRIGLDAPLRFPAVVRYDLSRQYAQAALGPDPTSNAMLRLESPQV